MAAPQAEAHGLTQRRTALVSIAAAAVLTALKLGVGLVSGSLGLISTGIESSGDIVAATLTFFAIRLGGRPADPGHPYGHRRAENLGALGEAGILMVGGLLVAGESIARLASGAGPAQTHWYQFAVIGLAVAVDVSRTVISLRAAKRFESPALRSNALHFSADLASSLTVLLGLLVVHLGFPAGDSIAALLVACVIIAGAIRLIAEHANVLMDRAPASAREAAERAVAALGAEVELRRLRLRESAGRYFADVVVTVPPGQAVVEGHQAANRVEAAVERALPGSDVVVHVEPRHRGLDLRERILAIALAEPLVLEAHDIAIFAAESGASVSLHLKFAADLDLASASRVARRVEQAIAARPEVSAVQTHLEPLEQARALRAADEAVDARAEDQIARVVRARTGLPPQRVALLSVTGGRVLFLTLRVSDAESLMSAHRLAGELEDELRMLIPDIVDVVIRTEPSAEGFATRGVLPSDIE